MGFIKANIIHGLLQPDLYDTMEAFINEDKKGL